MLLLDINVLRLFTLITQHSSKASTNGSSDKKKNFHFPNQSVGLSKFPWKKKLKIWTLHITLSLYLITRPCKCSNSLIFLRLCYLTAGLSLKSRLGVVVIQQNHFLCPGERYSVWVTAEETHWLTGHMIKFFLYLYLCINAFLFWCLFWVLRTWPVAERWNEQDLCLLSTLTERQHTRTHTHAQTRSRRMSLILQQTKGLLSGSLHPHTHTL